MLDSYIKVARYFETKGVCTAEDYFRFLGYKEVPKEYYA